MTRVPPRRLLASPIAETVTSTWLPARAKGGSVAVNGNTSCEFAANVTEGFRQHGLGVVTAYSPVTGIWYDMTCSQAGVKLVQCTGGNNAAVYIRE